MGKVIIPKTYVKKLEEPLIFLAGPVKGAPNWQDEAVDILFSLEKDIMVALPKREIEDKIAKYVIVGDENYFPRQRAWERHYLDIASRTGTILFWLPGEIEHKCEKAYGAMTRFELGLTLGWYKYNKEISFCVGTDLKFSEFYTIHYDLQRDAPDKKIMPTLEESCAEAVRITRLKK